MNNIDEGANRVACCHLHYQHQYQHYYSAESSSKNRSWPINYGCRYRALIDRKARWYVYGSLCVVKAKTSSGLTSSSLMFGTIVVRPLTTSCAVLCFHYSSPSHDYDVHFPPPPVLFWVRFPDDENSCCTSTIFLQPRTLLSVYTVLLWILGDVQGRHAHLAD